MDTTDNKERLTALLASFTTLLAQRKIDTVTVVSTCSLYPDKQGSPAVVWSSNAVDDWRVAAAKTMTMLNDRVASRSSVVKRQGEEPRRWGS